jgi:hypothetical protein
VDPGSLMPYGLTRTPNQVCCCHSARCLAAGAKLNGSSSRSQELTCRFVGLRTENGLSRPVANLALIGNFSANLAVPGRAEASAIAHRVL